MGMGRLTERAWVIAQALLGWAGLQRLQTRFWQDVFNNRIDWLGDALAMEKARALDDEKEVNMMPGGDGTGPMGMGPMTGRGLGYCAGYAAPGYAAPGFGMGRARGFRRRMYYMNGLPCGARYGAYPYGFTPYACQGTAPEADEKEVLQNQAEFLEKQLKEVRERLKGFEKDE
jgi:hypothetical protein